MIWDYFKRKGTSTFMAKQDGNDILVCYYHKFTDAQLEIAIQKEIQDQIESLALKSLENKVFKKAIDIKTRKLFRKFLGDQTK